VTPTPGDRAYQLLNGFRASQVVHAACALRIPDLLASQPLGVAALSNTTEIDASRLERLLRALIGLGVLEQNEDGTYSNTDVGDLFRSETVGSRRATTMMLIPESYASWGLYMEVLKTGIVGHVVAHGGTLWDSVARDPDYAERFNAAMASNSTEAVDFVSSSLDFSGANLVVDVGGGKGALIGGILRAHTHLRGVVCDLAPGLTQTAAYLGELGVADRCSIVEADFFESVPRSGDVYLLKDIIHDWDDQPAAKILAVCRSAMAGGSRLAIVERLVPAPVTGNEADLNAVMTDLQMMVQLGSRERTFEEFRSLLDGAGFRDVRLIPSDGVWKIVEAAAF